VPDIPLTEPLQLRAGLTWTWKRSLTDFPSPTWVLAYQFKNATDHFELTAAQSGTSSDHLVNSAFAATAAIVPGSYGWTASATSGVDRFEVGSGRITILPNTVNTGLLEERSTARQILYQLEARYLDFRTNQSSSGAVLSYQIGDRQMTFGDPQQFVESLIKDISYWRNKVWLEDASQSIAQGLGNPRKTFVRFGA
jgi:hypothetical protein